MGSTCILWLNIYDEYTHKVCSINRMNPGLGVARLIFQRFFFLDFPFFLEEALGLGLLPTEDSELDVVVEQPPKVILWLKPLDSALLSSWLVTGSFI